MGSREHAAKLRALADAHEELGDLEDAARAAKDGYRAALESGDQQAIDAARSAHRAASQALGDARTATAESGVMAAPTIPGSQTIIPATVKAG